MIFRLIILALSTPFLSGQTLQLRSENKLQGTVAAITEEDGLQLKTPYSPDTINFRLDAIEEVVLDESEEGPGLQTERLVLSNGDVLPGKLTSLSKESLGYEGLFAGNLSIPRAQVDMMRLDVKPQRVIYEGPFPLKEWSGDGVDKWDFQEQTNLSGGSETLKMMERGEISQDLGLESQFILKFELMWPDEPDMRLRFCEDLSGTDDDQRPYYLSINSSGLQIRRELSGSGGQETLLKLRDPEAFDDKSVAVELRCNRALGTLTLFLDGELIRRKRDRSERPTGTGVSILQTGGSNRFAELSHLQILSWDAASLIDRDEETEKRTEDALITSDGSRMSGELRELKIPETPEDQDSPEENETSPKRVFLFDSPLAEKELELGSDEVRVLLFRDQSEPREKEPAPFEILLHNEGKLSATNLSLNDEFLTITHSLIGPLELERSTVKSFRHLSPDDES